MGKITWIFELWRKRPLLARMWILAALFLFFSVETRSFLTNPSGSEARLIAAKRNLEPGMILSIADLTVAYVPNLHGHPMGSFTEQEAQQLVGALVTEKVATGELITQLHVHLKKPSFSERVPKGLRAFPIDTEEALPLTTGDSIDIQVINPDDPHLSFAVVEDRKILGIQKTDGNQTVVVALNTDEAIKLNSLRQKGRFHLSLRNPMDNSKNMSSGEAPAKSAKLKKIQIIEEGE